MHRCNCGDDNTTQLDRSHVFVDLNGFPYLLAEYMNRKLLLNADRSAIVSGITVDTSDAMRAVIDISINDIGERSDSTPNIVGNNTKMKRLLDMISRHANGLDGKLPVLKNGIVVRINYQLENLRTQQVIRSMVEDLRITDRAYFVDINRINFNDNGIVVNFNNSMVSTINEFTHGRDRMVIKITNIQLFYELVADHQPVPRIKQSLTSHPYDYCNNDIISGTNEEYYYHKGMQNQHYLGDPPGYDSYRENSMLRPPQWAIFNQFYHFDQEGRRIILHYNEIYDPLRKVTLIPCGNVNVNRKFVINPGHRLIFKISIWKNDVTAVFDTLKVAQALKAKFYNCCDEWHNGCDHNHHEHDHHHHHCNHEHPEDHHHHHGHYPDEYQQLISMLYDERKQNELNGKTITELLERIKILEENQAGKDDPTEPPIEPVDPDKPSTDCECGCDHADINEKINNIAQRLEEEDIDPMPEKVVDDLYYEALNEAEGGI